MLFSGGYTYPTIEKRACSLSQLQGRLNTPDACTYMDVVAGADNAGLKDRGHNRSENLSNLLLCEEPQKG